MIDAKELRIGNYILSDESSVEVSSYCEFNGIETTANFEGNCNSKITPIELTHEILLKCGFEKNYRIDSGEYNECFSIFSFALMVRHNSFFVDWIGGNTEVKYLHQLQNIFYCLCGEELEINLH